MGPGGQYRQLDPKAPPRLSPLAGPVVGPGQGESMRGGQALDTLPPTPQPRAVASTPPPPPSAEGAVPPPCWSQQIRYQSPGPWSFGAAEIARARAAVTPGRRSRPQRTHTHQHAPRRAESLPELVKGTSPFQTNRRTWNHNPGCSEPSPGEAGLGRQPTGEEGAQNVCRGGTDLRLPYRLSMVSLYPRGPSHRFLVAEPPELMAPSCHLPTPQCQPLSG